MEQVGTILILYLVGAGLLVAEIFIPSYGILTVAGLGVFGTAIYFTYQENPTAGHVSVILSLIFLPTMGFLSIKYWHQTPVGKLISPPNPVVTAADTGDWEAKLSPYVGKIGRSLSQLRPVGTCEFDGERLECIAEMGVIDRDQPVKAIAVRGRNLSVAVAEDSATTA